MDGHEIDGRGELRGFEPELPNVGVGDRKARAPPNLFQIGLDPIGPSSPRSNVSLPTMKASITPGCRRAIRNPASISRRFSARLRPDPDSLQDLQANLVGNASDLAVRRRGGIGADAGRHLRQLFQVTFDLPYGICSGRLWGARLSWNGAYDRQFSFWPWARGEAGTATGRPIQCQKRPMADATSAKRRVSRVIGKVTPCRGCDILCASR